MSSFIKKRNEIRLDAIKNCFKMLASRKTISKNRIPTLLKQFNEQNKKDINIIDIEDVKIKILLVDKSISKKSSNKDLINLLNDIDIETKVIVIAN